MIRCTKILFVVFLCSGFRMKLVDFKQLFTLVVNITDHSKAAVPVLLLLCLAL